MIRDGTGASRIVVVTDRLICGVVGGATRIVSPRRSLASDRSWGGSVGCGDVDEVNGCEPFAEVVLCGVKPGIEVANAALLGFCGKNLQRFDNACIVAS
jgi:hypothetical protein